MADKILMSEFKALSKEPWTNIELIDENIFSWHVALIVINPDSVYNGAFFKAKMTFPKNYPYSPPEFKFTRPMFHPNVYPDGKLCISILHPPGEDEMSGELAAERWSPAQRVESVLISILSLLDDAEPSSPANVDAGVMLRNNPEAYKQRARQDVEASKADIPEGFVMPTQHATYKPEVEDNLFSWTLESSQSTLQTHRHNSLKRASKHTMADYAPPPGPPPPRVPEGWKAQWNDQYKEWFYVNLHTKQSQWEKPTEPAYPSSGGPPPGAPPGYDSHQPQNLGPEKGGYASNNPYGGSSIHSGGSSQNVNDDEAYARKLQAEEEARARQSGQSTARAGASDSYYGSGTPQYQSQTPQYQSQSQPQYSNELPPRNEDRGRKGGLFGKLLGKASGSSSRPQQGYGQQGYPSGGMMGGGYPQQQYGGYPQQGYGGYPQQQAYAQPQRKHGGMGGMGGMALGAGAGLLGGALLMDGIDHMEDNAYEQGYENGGGGDDYGNDDYGGGGDDFGGGDF